MVKPVLGKPAESSDSKYKGVRKRKWGKWVSEIRLPNSRERIWLGSYDSPEKAARAFDAALFCLRGRSAKFNFPHNPPDIVGAASLSRPEIQAAAAHFANSVPPTGKVPEEGRCSSSSSSLSSSSSELRTECPSPSVSDGAAAQVDSEMPALDGSFLDLFATVGTENNNNNNNSVPDFGIFPGFDDLSFDDPGNEYFMAAPPPSVDYGGEETIDMGCSQHSFLWNF